MIKLTSTKILLFSILLVLAGGFIHLGVLGSSSSILVILGLLLGIVGVLVKEKG